ncbi:MAG: type III-A CRISPR-associated protein Csm2 [Acholeplasmataceae bacterium]|jgi:CRISPR-associated protein Csm2|nr:type III-A CRISPR-associated protein Csm2 [Acholeplasmataceae bacterium]
MERRTNILDVYNSIKKDYTKHADRVITDLKNEQENFIKTNQLRTLYSFVVPFSDFFNYGRKIDIEKAKRELKKLKIKIAYQIGRDDRGQLGVRKFNDASNILELIDVVIDSKNFIEDLELYCNYFEALVAYHKYHGGQ